MHRLTLNAVLELNVHLHRLRGQLPSQPQAESPQQPLVGGPEAASGASPVVFFQSKGRQLRGGLERIYQKLEDEFAEEMRRRSEPSEAQKAIFGDLLALQERPGDFSLERIEGLRGRILVELGEYEESSPDFPPWRKLRKNFEESERPSPEDYLEMLRLADAGPLWEAVKERIAQLDEQIDSAGLTDAIINLPRFWRDEDLELAPSFLDHQTQYIDVHRMLVEGKVKEAYEKFVALEKSHETRFLNDAFEESQTINRCSIQASIVIASGGMGAIAARLAGGLATSLGVTRGIALIEFGAMTTTFTVAERGLDHSIRGKRFFDPKTGSWENALEFGESLALNAGMFAFFGAAQKLFAGFAEKQLWAMAAAKAMPGARLDAKALAPEARVALQAEVARLSQKPLAEFMLKSGSFGTELAAFAAWDYFAANYQLGKSGSWDPIGLFESVFLSAKAWKERLSFLAALKAGHYLGAEAYRGMSEGIRKLSVSSSKALVPPLPKHRVNFSPAGLVVWPEEGADLLRLAQGIAEEAPSFPNDRMVLQAQEWKSPPNFDSAMDEGFRTLADFRGVTIAVKTAVPPYVREYIPQAEAARQASLGELRAAPSGDPKNLPGEIEGALGGGLQAEKPIKRGSDDAGINSTSFSMPMKIFGPDAPLTRGFRWLWRKLSPEKAKTEDEAPPESLALVRRGEETSLLQLLRHDLVTFFNPQGQAARRWRSVVYSLARGMTHYPRDRAEDIWGLGEIAEGLRQEVIADSLRALSKDRGNPIISPEYLQAMKIRAEAAGLNFEQQVFEKVLADAEPAEVESWFDALDLAPLEQVRRIRQYRIRGGVRRLWDLLQHSEFWAVERYEAAMALFDLGVPQVLEELFALGLEPSVMASEGARAELTQALESLGAWQGLIRLQEIWGKNGLTVLQSGYREIRASGTLAGTGIVLPGEFRDSKEQAVFSEQRTIHLAGRAGALSRRRYGEWRVQGFGKVRGRSYLVIERTKPPTAPLVEDASLPDQLVFFSAEPLVLNPKASRISFLVGKDSLDMGAKVYLVEVEGL